MHHQAQVNKSGVDVYAGGTCSEALVPHQQKHIEALLESLQGLPNGIVATAQGSGHT